MWVRSVLWWLLGWVIATVVGLFEQQQKVCHWRLWQIKPMLAEPTNEICKTCFSSNVWEECELSLKFWQFVGAASSNIFNFFCWSFKYLFQIYFVEVASSNSFKYFFKYLLVGVASSNIFLSCFFILHISFVGSVSIGFICHKRQWRTFCWCSNKPTTVAITQPNNHHRTERTHVQRGSC